MNVEEAKKILDGCVRSECRDHAFGDKEVFWTKNGVDTAEGYFGSSMASVTIYEGEDTTFSFKSDDALSLMNAGTLGQVGRNDETGPSEFSLGATMPGLTLEGVRQELEG